MPEFLEFGGFKKVNELVAPERLQADELQALVNMTLDDKTFNPVKRKGWSKFNPNLADPLDPVISTHDIVDANGANYVLTMAGTKLRKSLNGTDPWFELKTGLTQGKKTRVIPYGGKFIVTNGADSPFYTDCANVWDLAISSPDIITSGLSMSVEPGNLNWSDIFRYLIVYVTADGQRSNPSIAIDTSNGLGDVVQYKKYNFINVPISGDSRVVSKMIFRTKANAFDKYYLNRIIDNSLDAFSDDTPDDNLDVNDTIEYLNTPLKAGYGCVNGERIFLANISKRYSNRVIPPPRIPLGSSNGNSFIFESYGINGYISAGLYGYAYSYVDSMGNESDLVFLLNCAPDADNSTVTLKRFVFSIISGQSVNVRPEYLKRDIAKIRFYRTKKNAPPPYYWVGDFDLISDLDASWDDNAQWYDYSFIDHKNDSSLTVPYPKNASSNSATADLRSSVVFSNMSKFLEFPELNYIEVFPDDGDEITGLLDADNGVLVFKRNSICEILTNGDPENWQTRKLIENMGCTEPDSIYKNGAIYLFVSNKRPYLFAENALPKPIGQFYTQTLDKVTSFNGATYSIKKDWYLLAVSCGEDDFVLAYDNKLDTWYKFTSYMARTLSIKSFGTKQGSILLGGSRYLVFYDETKDQDRDHEGIPEDGQPLEVPGPGGEGTDSLGGGVDTIYDVSISLKTKVFSFPNGLTEARLRKLWIGYKGIFNPNDKDILFQIANPDTLEVKDVTVTATQATSSMLEKITDQMQGDLLKVQKFCFVISGCGLKEVMNFRLQYNPIPVRMNQ